MPGHVAVQDAAPIVADEEKAVEDREGDRGKREEFRRGYRYSLTWMHSWLFVEVNSDVGPCRLMSFFTKDFNPQSNPQHAASYTMFNDLSGVWQSPRFCKLLENLFAPR